MNKEEQQRQYYALTDLFEKQIQSFKENNYQEVNTEQYYEELMSIVNPEKEEESDKN